MRMDTGQQAEYEVVGRRVVFPWQRQRTLATATHYPIDKLFGRILSDRFEWSDRCSILMEHKRI